MMSVKGVLFSALLLSSIEAFGQKVGVFKSLRFEDDLEFFKNESPNTFYEHLKNIQPDKEKQSTISMGGELRFQYQYFSNELWGRLEDDPDGFILFRNLIHINYDNGKNFRAFAQLKNNSIQGRIHPVRSIDQNILGIHQAFGEWGVSLFEIPGYIRFGRQEASLGSQRLIASREGPNNRLSFDGLRVGFHRESYKLDLLYFLPVLETPGIFDGGINFDNKLFGAYFTKSSPDKDLNWDMYYLGISNSFAVFDAQRGEELRHSIGVRPFGRLGRFWGDVELVYQWGSFSDGAISAYTVSTAINYDFKIDGNPAIAGLKTELISGNQSVDDGVLGTFNPLFPMGAYFGLAALIGPSNLIDIHPSISYKPTKVLSFNVDYDLFWRFSIQDGLYGPNVRPIFSGVDASGRFVGSQLGLFTNFFFHPHLLVRLEHTYFQPGIFLREVSPGKDLNFTALTIQFKY